MVIRYIVITLIFLLTFTRLITNCFATDLSNLITSLYGGSGIPVTKVFEKEKPTGGIDVVTTVSVPLDSLLEIQNLNSELNTEKGAFPVSSTGGGFTFQYDSELEVFTRTTDSLGPVFAERASTLGKGKINFGFSYTYINYSTLQGEDLHNLESVVPLDEEQKMKLQKLTVLEQDKLKKDFEEVKKKIKELEELLASEQAILDIIKQDLQDLVDLFQNLEDSQQ